jgi:hypothetical protein
MFKHAYMRVTVAAVTGDRQRNETFFYFDEMQAILAFFPYATRYILYLDV